MKNTNNQNQKGAALIPLLIAFVVVLAGATGYFAFVRKPVQTPVGNNPPTATNGGGIDVGVPSAGTGGETGSRNGINNTGSTAVPAGWKTYRNEKYGFEFKYPEEWSVREISPSPESKNIPVKTYTLFEAKNVEISDDFAQFIVRFDIFTKQSGRVIIAGGPDYLLWYDFTKDKFFHGSTFGGEREYTTKSVSLAPGVSNVLFNSDGLPIVRSETFFPSPSHSNDRYFVVNKDKNTAFLFEFEYFGNNQELWISKNKNGLALKNEKKVVEIRDMLENLVKSLTLLK